MRHRIATLSLWACSAAVWAQEPVTPLPRDSELPDYPAFETIDKNHDGLLSRSEANSVDGLRFAEADANGDGSLDREEYAAGIAALFERRTER